MGYVIKTPVNESQIRTQTQNAEINSALRELRQNMATEINERSTADNTLQNDISALQEAITAELTALGNAEAQIQADLLTEKQLRESNDFTLNAAIQTESENREAADVNLSKEFNAKLDEEKNSRSQEILDMQAAILASMGNSQALEQIENDKLRQQIESESANQSANIAELSDRLQTETENRVNDDAFLLGKISDEATARQSAITDLQAVLNAAINNEVTNRQNADTQLQTGFNAAIAAETQNRNSAIGTLESSLKSYADSKVASVENNLNDFTAPTATANGTRGLVPAPAKGTEIQVLTNKGWRSPDDATLTVAALPVQAGTLTYNGSSQTPTWSGFDTKKLQISGSTSGVNAQTYTVTFTPSDLYVWSDTLDQTPKSQTWSIQPLKLAKPTASVTTFTYNGNSQGLNVSNFDSTYINQTGTISAINVNSYSAVYSLKNTTNTKWSDNSTGNVTVSWSIQPLKLAKPAASVTEFDCDGQTKTLAVSNYNAAYINQTGVVSASASGNYSVTYSLKNTTNTKWSDNSTADVTINWKINLRVLTAEQSAGFAQVGTLTYNGYSQSVTVKNYDANFHVLSGTVSSVNAGTFTAQISPKSGCVWNDNSTTPKNVSWTVQPKSVTIPVADNVSFDYDGTAKTLQVRNYDPVYMTQGGTITATAKGNYQASYALKNKTNLIWADNSTADKVIAWAIGSKSFTIPTLAADSFVYDGTEKTPVIKDFSADYMTVSGTVSAVNVANDGTVNSCNLDARDVKRQYHIYIELKDKSQTSWADNSTSKIDLIWYITPAKLSSTASNLSQQGTLTYNGNAQTPNIKNLNYNYHFPVIESKTDAGNYTALIYPHPNYYWSTGNATPKEISWSIQPLKLNKPAAAATVFTYDGNPHTLSISNYNADYMSETGTTTATNVSNYSVKYSLKNKTNTCWADSTTADVTISWKIEGQRLSEELSNLEQEGTLIYNGARQDVKIKNYNSTYHNLLERNIQGTNAGEYYFTVAPKSGYAWSDGTQAIKKVYWYIQILKLPKPTAAQTDFVYDGVEHSLEISNYNTAYMTQSGTLKATAGGAYSVSYTLNDAANTAWEDSSTDTHVIEWSIGMTKVTIPTLTTPSFTYDGNAHQVLFSNFDSANCQITQNSTVTNAGTYTVKVALTNSGVTVWADGTSSAKKFTVTVARKKLTATQSTFSQSGTLNYTGSSQTVTIKNYNANYHSLGGAYIAADAGIYEAEISPLSNYCWNDGTFETKIVTWTINAIKIAKPTADVTEFFYDKQTHSLNVQNYNANYMSQTGSISGSAAKGYAVTYKLLNPTSVTWDDDTVSSVRISWKISKRRLPKPTAAKTVFNYGVGITRTLSITGYDSTYMTQSGVIQAVNAGEYQVTYSLNDKTVLLWDDDSTDDVVIDWVINKAKLSAKNSAPYQKEIPVFTGSTVNIKSTTYIEGYLSANYQVWTGTISAVNAGEYTAFVSPSANYLWQDGTDIQKTVIWRIDKATVDAPTLGANPTYNGNLQSPTLTGYDSNKMNLSGDTAKIDAGNYTLQISPDSNHMWADSGTDVIELAWSVERQILTVKPTPKEAPSSNTIKRWSYTGSTLPTDSIQNYLNDFDSQTMYLEGDTSGVAFKQYALKISTKSNYAFKVGNYTRTSTVLYWYIDRKTFRKPTIEQTLLPYTGQNQSPNIKCQNSNGSTMTFEEFCTEFQKFGTITGTTAAKAQGSYSVTFSFNSVHGKNATWSSSGYPYDDYTLGWSIGVTEIAAPTVSTTYYSYTGANQSVSITGFDAGTMTKTGDTGKNRGFYTLTISLKDKTGTCWSTGGNADIVIQWAIGLTKVTKPALADGAQTVFDYDGTAKTLSVEGYSSSTMTRTGNASATNAGDYSVTYSLKNTTDYVWDDSTTADVTFTWKINRQPLADVIFKQDGSLVYTGASRTVTVKNFDASLYDIGGVTSAVNAGEYTAYISPKSNYCWADSTTAAKSVTWKIKPHSVFKPDIQQLEFEWDGAEKTLSDKYGTYNKNYCTRSGMSATATGNYTAVWSLNDKENCVWGNSGGSTADISIAWKITPIYLEKPTLTPLKQTSKGYGSIHSVTVEGFDENTMTKTGDISTDKLAGDVEVTFGLKDNVNYAWTGGNSDDFTATWTILPFIIDPADIVQDRIIVYDGEEHSFREAFSYLDSTQERVIMGLHLYATAASTEKATEPGEYTVQLAPKSYGTQWKGGGISKNFTWTITAPDRNMALTRNIAATDDIEEMKLAILDIQAALLDLYENQGNGDENR